MRKANFTSMDQGTRDDYDVVFEHEAENVDLQADRVLQWLRDMDVESPYPVTRLGHALQCATRAERDGADEEIVVCALLHDIGDMLAPANHSQAAAVLLRP